MVYAGESFEDNVVQGGGGMDQERRKGMDSNSIVNAGGPGQIGAKPFLDDSAKRAEHAKCGTWMVGVVLGGVWLLASWGDPDRTVSERRLKRSRDFHGHICTAVALMGAARRREGRLGSTQPWRMD